MVNLERCKGSCNTLDDPSSQVFVTNETEDVNLSVFNMKIGITGSKTLIKLISSKCKCKFDCRKYNSNQSKWIFRNYLINIGDSVITCD